jgi:hypothetical protein
MLFEQALHAQLARLILRTAYSIQLQLYSFAHMLLAAYSYSSSMALLLLAPVHLQDSLVVELQRRDGDALVFRAIHDRVVAYLREAAPSLSIKIKGTYQYLHGESLVLQPLPPPHPTVSTHRNNSIAASA